ncbi:uncharacterized protein LOC126656261 [Mercurialis annua]|uniref:uncharacterized protein LOC126656261 n=1 Tax=Mercurialis annua TaxID=3986 RepID=UPI0021609D42|nr:uncharacterized protein LOC126656261 [Mercurialis annua]
MDKTWMVKSWNSDEYKAGVEQFLKFAFCNASQDGKILCPCRCCVNRYLQTREETRVHLRCDGFLPGYTKWICHGEKSSDASTSSIFSESTSSRGVEYVQVQPNLRKPDDIVGLLHDAMGVVRQVGDNISLDVDEEVDSENAGIDIEQPGVSTTGVSSEFQKLLEDVDKEVYPGCKTFSKLSCILHIYHMKYLNGWTEKSGSMLLEFLFDLLPEGALLPKTYYEAKKIITTLGLDYKKIDACENDCMLFWGEKSSDEICSKCGTSRWVVNKNEQVKYNDNSVNKPAANRKKPAKVLRYFPLIPRLQRLFISKKTSTDMRWHVMGRIEDGMLRHPADGVAWKAFDAQFPNFSSDPRNVRFGLSSDGFNPFRTMSTNYSTWPVMLIPYNMSPWICMKQSSFILSMIIPGKKGPGNDIDIYLQPLIEELKLLWEGVETYDAFGSETFNLRGALMWTINDFPAYAYLSGWSTKGKFACPCCAEFTNSRWLYKGGKHCYMGHRRWLPHDHSFRFMEHLFDGTQELGTAPVRATSGDVLNQLDDLQFGLDQLGKYSKSKKGKRKKQTVDIDEANPEMEIDVDDLRKAAMKHWKKKSIFFMLPYWEHNLLRHNLDVMHIEKNVCDNLIGTLLNLEYKSKDNEKARLDLVDMGIREELHPIEDANGKRRLPLACFSLTSTEKDIFCQVLKNMKLPDGYSSNFSRCVNLKDRKISGLKSHDCHILIEDLLPLALKACSPSKQLTSIVIELAAFFKSICSKSIDPKELDKI